ncbi:MAG: hypothetical protein JSV22_00475 [Bacteroidales bacterium]|nr:MAG: hypothetical protein JSV22_00475 [Bacteroidales bacterium]
MFRSVFYIIVISVLISGCATLGNKVKKHKLDPVSKIFIASYDEEGKISVFVPPELKGVKIWGSFAATHIFDSDNSTLEQAVNQILSPWNFNEYLLDYIESSINNKCNKLPFVQNEGARLAVSDKSLPPESPGDISKDSEFIRTLDEQSFDALMVFKLRYYGPHTTSVFAKSQLRCAVDIQLLSVPSLKMLWKERINLEKIESDEILFQLPMYEYIENNCKNLKTALEKAAETISNEICNNLCY